MIKSLCAMALSAVVFTVPATAQTYSAASVGAGCGATLTVTWTPLGVNSTQMGLRAENLHPSTLGGMIFGVNPVTIGPVLTPGCFVHTQAIWATQFQTDTAGVQTWQRAWPASILGAFYIQMGTIDLNTLEVRLTNCMLASHQ